LHDVQQAYCVDTAPKREGGLSSETIQLVQKAIRMSDHILARNPTALVPQLLGRLPQVMSSFRDRLAAHQLGNWLEPVRSGLNAADSALIRTLEGHSGVVTATAFT